MMFHWKYADERSLEKGQVGWFIEQIANPEQEAQMSSAIDQKFANSPYETKTDTEKAFQSSFVSMFGNLNVLLGQHCARRRHHDAVRRGNTMAMSVRERTTEIAVMRTLGFQQHTIFALIAGEGLMMAFVGGVLGAVLAKVDRHRRATSAPAASFPISASAARTSPIGIALGAFIGVVAGIIPATMAVATEDRGRAAAGRLMGLISSTTTCARWWSARAPPR